jgi:hypothetical protein
MIENPAAPPLVMTTKARYHAVTPLGGCACDDRLALNLQHTQEAATVPAGLRCREVECVRRFRGDP